MQFQVLPGVSPVKCDYCKQSGRLEEALLSQSSVTASRRGLPLDNLNCCHQLAPIQELVPFLTCGTKRTVRLLTLLGLDNEGLPLGSSHFRLQSHFQAKNGFDIEENTAYRAIICNYCRWRPSMGWSPYKIIQNLVQIIILYRYVPVPRICRATDKRHIHL